LDYAIKTSQLTKIFDDIIAVDRLDLDVKRGEIFGFLGPNGAGKTTTVRILSTVLKPDEGTATVVGHDVVSEPEQVRRKIGVVTQKVTVDPELTGFENLDFQAKLYDVPKLEREKRIKELLETVQLWGRRDDLVFTYSGGMQRRLEIVRALVSDPEVLFLDEPTTGLDPQARRMIWDYLFELKKEGVTIFLTTHTMEEAEVLCERTAIIDYGKLLVCDSPDELKEQIPIASSVELELEKYDEEVEKLVKDLAFTETTVWSPETSILKVLVENVEESLPELLETLMKKGIKVFSVNAKNKTLEDVFIHYTGRSLREDTTRKKKRFVTGFVTGV